ncbi:MAG: VF530 family protein [Verrucomicrobia bacterium]|nr:VF530 family protein [Verrucomicrobiota bacterium]
MHAAGPKNPLHGITLEKMLTELEAHYGWEMLGRKIKINCFNFHPSIKSSLVFLRRTPWARQKVEELYIDSLPDLKAKTDEPTQDTSEEPPSPEATIENEHSV